MLPGRHVIGTDAKRETCMDQWLFVMVQWFFGLGGGDRQPWHGFFRQTLSKRGATVPASISSASQQLVSDIKITMENKSHILFSVQAKKKTVHIIHSQNKDNYFLSDPNLKHRLQCVWVFECCLEIINLISYLCVAYTGVIILLARTR